MAQGMPKDHKNKNISNNGAFRKCHGPCALVELMVV
jgi:hypothetical protein